LPCGSSPSPRRPIPAGGNAVRSGISASLVLPKRDSGLCFAKLSATALPISVVVFAFRDAAGTDHFDVVVHQGAGARGVANLDQVNELGMNFENMLREFRCGSDVAAWPRNVLQRNQLHDQHAVVR